MPTTKKEYAELAIYSEKITKEEFRGFFEKLVKRNIPIFESIDFSRWFSFSGFNMIIKRHDNTIKMYVGGINVFKQSALLFPFRLKEPKVVELDESHFSASSRFVTNINFFDFLVKENVSEIRFKVVKFFGKYLGFGNFITKDGSRGILYLSNPTKFLEIDLEKNPLFYIELLDPIPKTVYLNSKEPIFEEEEGETTIGVDNFSALQHSLIIGSSGTGKSKFIEIMIRSIKKKYGDGVRVLVIDPHGEFSKTFEGDMVVDFVNNYVEPFDVGKSKSPLITQLVAQLITSTISQENKYAERVVFYAVHMLASVDQLTLENLNLLLTDSAKRMEFSSQCQNDEVRRFFDEEFQNIYLHHFNDAILPVINFIGEYLLYLGKARNLEKLEDLMNKNQVTVVSFNPHYFGRKIIRFFAGAIINQVYMMAISERLKKPTILVVDEFPTVESKVTKDILAETRKFNLYMHVSAQYLGQLSKVVLDAIISNARNIIAFKCTREDANILVSMMEIKVEEFFKKKTSPSELEESKKEMFLKLHPREAIVRLFDGNKYILPMKVKTVDLNRWRPGHLKIEDRWEPRKEEPPEEKPEPTKSLLYTEKVAETGPVVVKEPPKTEKPEKKETKKPSPEDNPFRNKKD